MLCASVQQSFDIIIMMSSSSAKKHANSGSGRPAKRRKLVMTAEEKISLDSLSDLSLSSVWADF